MKVFLQVFAAVFVALSITFGSALWILHGEVESFKLTISQNVTKIVDAVKDFSLFGTKPKPPTKPVR